MVSAVQRVPIWIKPILLLFIGVEAFLRDHRIDALAV